MKNEIYNQNLFLNKVHQLLDLCKKSNPFHNQDLQVKYNLENAQMRKLKRREKKLYNVYELLEIKNLNNEVSVSINKIKFILYSFEYE